MRDDLVAFLRARALSRTISCLLDQRAWSKDMGRLLRRVEQLNAAGPSRELEAAAIALTSLRRAPIGGYRRTRNYRHSLWDRRGVWR